MKLSHTERATLVVLLTKPEQKALLMRFLTDANETEQWLYEQIAKELEGEIVKPEEIGALTSATLIATGVTREDGKIKDVKRVYYDNQYAIRNLAEDLARNGSVSLYITED